MRANPNRNPNRNQVLPACELSAENILGATLAFPASFFNLEATQPGFWGYVGIVQKKVGVGMELGLDRNPHSDPNPNSDPNPYQVKTSDRPKPSL